MSTALIIVIAVVAVIEQVLVQVAVKRREFLVRCHLDVLSVVRVAVAPFGI